MNPTQIAAEAVEEIDGGVIVIGLTVAERAGVQSIIQTAIESYVTQPKEIPLTDGKFATVDHQDFISKRINISHAAHASEGKCNAALVDWAVSQLNTIDGTERENARQVIRNVIETTWKAAHASEQEWSEK